MNDKVSGALDKSSSALTILKKELGLIGAWKYCTPNLKEFTFIDSTGKGHDSRIDLWLVPKLITKNIKSCKIVQAPAPDHKAVVLEISITERKRGAGYRKMNNSILNDEEFKNGINKVYCDALDQYEGHVPNMLLWDYIKVKIKEYTVSYCTIKSKSISVHNQIKELENTLDVIDTSKANCINDSKIDSERKLIKQKLDSLYEQRATGYYIRSRAKWIEEGERSTSYFLGLEKVRQSSNSINCLKDASGKQHHSDCGILGTAKSFYEQLYESKSISLSELDEYFKSLPVECKLDEDAKSQCGGPVTYNECERALSMMKSNKSPGLDSIATEFYKKFWPILGNLLV